MCQYIDREEKPIECPLFQKYVHPKIPLDHVWFQVREPVRQALCMRRDYEEYHHDRSWKRRSTDFPINRRYHCSIISK